MNGPTLLTPCPPLPDRDQSPNDRGAYGGPFGEVRQKPVNQDVYTVPWQPHEASVLLLLGALLSAFVALRRRQARGRSTPTGLAG